MVIVFSALSFFPFPATAQNATSLTISAPSSVENDDSFGVTLEYTANGSSICGASCEVSGGWLGYIAYPSQGSGCLYEDTISAYGPAGEYSLQVYCYKVGYDSQLEYFDIEITEKSSSLSVSLSPDSPLPGEIVTVYAYYEDDGGSLIPDGTCTADLTRNGEKFDSISLVFWEGSYYSGALSVPHETGNYDVDVHCTSSEHESEYSSETFSISKRPSSISVSIPGSAHYGESVSVVAYYNSLQGGVIQGTCRAHFNGKTSDLAYTGRGYEGSILMPYAEGTHSADITCESDGYETAEISRVITAKERPASIDVISPGQGKEFYPTDGILLKSAYKDGLSGGYVQGAVCYAEAGGKQHRLSGSGNYYTATLEDQPIGDQRIRFSCSKTFYTRVESSIETTVVRIPLRIELTSQKNEFRPGEDIEMTAKVTAIRNNVPEVDCRARADVYSLSLNRLMNSYDITDIETKNDYRTLGVPNPGEPSRIRVTMICYGDIYEENSAYKDLKIEMLGKETEEGITLVLTATTLILIALILLIRKKLKII